MHAQRSTAALRQHLEVAGCLRLRQDTERIALSRNLEVLGIVGGELQEDSGIWPTLVQLARRVQEPRSVTERRCHPFRVPDRVADGLQQLVVRVVHLQVGGEGEVVAGPDTRQVRPEQPREVGATRCGLQPFGVPFQREERQVAVARDRREPR